MRVVDAVKSTACGSAGFAAGAVWGANIGLAPVLFRHGVPWRTKWVEAAPYVSQGSSHSILSEL